MWSIIIGAIIGGICAALITILVENLRKPKLTLTIAEPMENRYEGRPAQLKRAVRLQIQNEPLPIWAKWMARSPALQCGGSITFHHLDGQDVFGRAMIIRFPESPEPIPLMFHFRGEQAQIVDPARMVLEQRKDVFPGKSELIDVACRYDEDEECYGWNNESYFSNPLWRNPNWRLPEGRYLMKINIAASGQTCSGLFRLINDVGIHDFRLERALPEDHENIRIAGT